MRNQKLAKALMIFLIIFAALALTLAIYFLPPVHERLSWRVASLRTRVFHYFNPPGEAAFSPGQQDQMEAIVNLTMTAMAPPFDPVPGADPHADRPGLAHSNHHPDPHAHPNAPSGGGQPGRAQA
jgi:hypothetical protein